MIYLSENRKWIVFNTLVWCVAKVLFLAIKLWGIENTPLQIDINTVMLLLAIAITGLFDGFILGITDIEFDNKFTKLHFSERIISKTIINMIIGLTQTVVFVPMLMGWDAGSGIALFSKKLITANLVIMGVYVFLISLLLQLSKLAASWIQTNDLLQIFSHDNDGVEEDRIFMFLDMKSSTTHAEKLGAGRYSMLVQDCFLDMTKAAKLSYAEIYQYVGDEAIFTWKTSDSNFRNSVRHYFYFTEHLRQRSAYYRQQYGIVPEFKAGIHHGKVIRTQVGGIRKSIAFHGDAINTASRIQGKCNELSRSLLVSEAIKEGLLQYYDMASEGVYQLRGKDCKINLFSIREPVRKFEKHNFHQVKVNQQKVQCRKARLPLFRLWLNML